MACLGLFNLEWLPITPGRAPARRCGLLGAASGSVQWQVQIERDGVLSDWGGQALLNGW